MQTSILLNFTMFAKFLTSLLTLSLTNGFAPTVNSITATNGSVKVINNEDLVYRLPDTILPSRYDLEITVDLEQFIFGGSVKIHIHCTVTTNTVMLHSKNILVNWNLVKLVDVELSQEFTLNRYEENPVTDITTMIFNEELIANKNYIITLDMSGIITDEPSGLYRSSYTRNGEVR